MITGIVFDKIVKVQLSAGDKFKVGKEKVGTNEVPYVRYKFDGYTEDEINFIKAMKKIFVHAVHIVDVNLQDSGVADYVEFVRANVENVCLFGCYTLDDSSKDDLESVLQDFRDCTVLSVLEKVVLKDETTYMMLPHFDNIKKQLFRTTGIDNVSICSSPATTDENCCISAEYSRHLASRYGDEETVNVVATYQTKGLGCHCVRYVVINEDIVKCNGDKAGSSNKEANKKDGGSKESKSKKKTKSKQVGSVPMGWL